MGVYYGEEAGCAPGVSGMNWANSIPGEVVRPSVGYLFVAMICTNAGRSLATGNPIPTSLEAFQICTYLILLVPYFISRNSLYENRNDDRLKESGIRTNRQLLSLVVFLPLLLLTMGLLYAIVSLWVLIDHEVIVDMLPFLLKLGFALIGFYLYGIWIANIWPEAGEAKIKNKVYTFRYEVLFPGLMTCAVSFVFGWSLSRPVWSILYFVGWLIIFFAASLIDYTNARPKSFLRRKFAPPWISGFGFLSLIIIAGVPYVLNITAEMKSTLDAYLIAYLMTLLMLLAEAWRVIARRRNSDSSLANDYVSGTNQVMCIFPPLFLLTIFHPATNAFYAPLVLIAVGAEYVIWFKNRDPKTYGFWNWWGLISGFAIPILIMFGTIKPSNQIPWTFLGNMRGSAIPIFIFCLSSIIFTGIIWLGDKSGWVNKYNTRKFVALTGTVVSGLLAFVEFCEVSSASGESKQEWRILYAKTFYFFIVLIVSSICAYLTIKYKLAASQNKGNRSNAET